eukprot:TRINITY_DN108309_c0_g1_i1.p1 TRINITY_DN108309_c0_g1~~TRINITY_DN108309_c0_g1_i1.p1  ORF type:complete len:569 (+),score=106.19 TRINITY_DN108309_c0_g1_i1:18-1724(+)
MSRDLVRLQGASDLRDWEESRSKDFSSWRACARELLAGLRVAAKLGSSQHQQLAQLLRERSAADRAYAQALSSGLLKGQETDGSRDSVGASPLLGAIASIHCSVSKARESFAANVLDGLLAGLAQTTSEFEETSSRLLQGLEKSLVAADEANGRACDAMSAYHRSSIEDPSRARQGSGSTWFAASSRAPSQEGRVDAWLEEHRYRWAVSRLQQQQRSFALELSSALRELSSLEVWREEMCRKVVGSFCTKLHQVETNVQSLANDAIKALADARREPLEQPVRREMEKVLSIAVAEAPAQPSSEPKQGTSATSSSADEFEKWPAVQRLHDLCRPIPLPATMLSCLSGSLQAPRRWSGPQLCAVMLSKDHWLHCFQLEASRVQSVSQQAASSTARGPSGGGVDGLGLGVLEAEPQWSIFVPGCSVTSPVSGKARCFEIEDAKKNFLGLRNSRKEVLQARTDADLLRWVAALIQAGAESRATLPGLAVYQAEALRGAAGQSKSERPPPPPPPPPPATAAESETEKVESATKPQQPVPPRLGEGAKQPVAGFRPPLSPNLAGSLTVEDVFGQ